MRAENQVPPGYALIVVAPIAAGLIAALAYMLAALAAVISIDFKSYPEIHYVCEKFGVTDVACRDGALHAGVAMCVGLVAVLAIVVASGFLSEKAALIGPARVHTLGVSLLCAAAALVCGLHVWQEAMGATTYFSRLAEIRVSGTWISLENLLWPLILQIFVSIEDRKARTICGSALILIAAMSPYRAVLFGIVIFALMLIGRSALRRGLNRRRVVTSLLVTGVVIASFASIFVLQTRVRVDGANSSLIKAAIVQRFAMPLFQAHAVDRAARSERLPNFADDILAKLRLSDTPNLNHLLYQKIYGDATNTGGTTPLFYGEGVVNFPPSPLFWIIIAALIPAAAAIGLEFFGVEVGVIAGVAIWRGSLGGISDVLPAMILQMIVSALLFGSYRSLENVRSYLELRWPRIVPSFSSFIVIALSIVAAVNLIAIWQTGRHTEAIGIFELSDAASSAANQCGRIQEISQKRLVDTGLGDRHAVPMAEIFQTRLRIHVAINDYQRGKLEDMFRQIGEDLTLVVRDCRRSLPPAALTIKYLDIETEPIRRVGPLDLIAFVLSFVCAVEYMRLMWWRRISRSSPLH